MKIIGKSGDGYFVDIRPNELEKLTGFYYGKSNFKVGQTVRVDDLYMQLTALGKQEKEIKKISHALKTAAGMLEKIDPIFFEAEGT